MKGLTRSCKNCNTEFLHTKRHHKFCSEECTKEYIHKNIVTYPKYKCTKCRYEIQLAFSPIDDPRRFMEHECEKCGCKNTEN